MRHVVQQTDEGTKIKHVLDIQGINKPWIWLLIPLLAGAVWLAGNTWVITDNIDKPYILWAGPATLGSILATWIIINFFKTIAGWCKAFWCTAISYLKEPGSKFWIATSIFLAVSVLESGLCFGEILGDSILYRALGYAVAVAIDSVSVICILARQGAVRRNDHAGTWLYMFGIIVCASLSTLANGYITHEHYVAPLTVAGSVWQQIAPILGVFPPLLVVFLGFASDYTMDQASSKLDPDAYQQTEENRIRFYEIQRDMLMRRKGIQEEINRLHGRPEKVQRTFFLVDWFFPVVMPPVDTTLIVTAVVEELRKVSPAIEAPKSEPVDVEDDASVDMYPLLADDRFIDNLVDDVDVEDDGFEDEVVDTGERETVNNQVTPKPRITKKLDDTILPETRITDKLKPSTRKTQNGQTDAAKRIRQMVKRNPDIQPAEITKKVSVTRQYASKIKAQVLAEMTGSVQ